MASISCFAVPLTPRNYFAVQRIPAWYASKFETWLKMEGVVGATATVLGLLLAGGTEFTICVVLEESDTYKARPLGWVHPVKRHCLDELLLAQLQEAVASWAEEP